MILNSIIIFNSFCTDMVESKGRMFVLVARIIILIFTSMKNNSIRKQNSYGSVNPEVYPFVISDLEQTI